MSRFTCALCGWNFNGISTDEEKAEEFKDLYGEDLSTVEAREEVVSLCDDCYEIALNKLQEM